MEDDDIRQFAPLLSNECRGERLRDSLAQCGLASTFYFQLQGHTILYAQDGVEFHLAPNAAADEPRVSFVRFLSPEYCRGKERHPYTPRLIGELTFPLDQNTVRKQLGTPSATGNPIARYDEYSLANCRMRFVYPTKSDHVVFVELYALDDTTVKSGRPQLAADWSKIRDDTWQQRWNFYQSEFGVSQRAWPATESSGGPMIDVLSFRDPAGVVALVTSGMSDASMPLHEGVSEASRLELFTYADDVNENIVRRLRQDAMFPFAERTWLGHGDTINWMAPLLPGSELTADLFIYSIVAEHRRLPFRVQGDDVDLLWCVPITDAELRFKKARGIDALLQVLDEEAHPLRLDAFRKSYI
jgi:hypothetical protein